MFVSVSILAADKKEAQSRDGSSLNTFIFKLVNIESPSSCYPHGMVLVLICFSNDFFYVLKGHVIILTLIAVMYIYMYNTWKEGKFTVFIRSYLISWCTCHKGLFWNSQQKTQRTCNCKIVYWVFYIWNNISYIYLDKVKYIYTV